jgi:hypothetical protein
MKAHDEKPLNSMNCKFVLLADKKILVLHLRGRGYQLAVLHALGSDQFAGDFVNLVGPAAYNDDFETVVLV